MTHFSSTYILEGQGFKTQPKLENKPTLVHAQNIRLKWVFNRWDEVSIMAKANEQQFTSWEDLPIKSHFKSRRDDVPQIHIIETTIHL